jgi:iron(III) transport system substrate-binding protein
LKNSFLKPPESFAGWVWAGALALLLAFSGAGGAADTRAAGRGEWERTIEAARKEKQVVLYASDRYGELFQEFQKKFPDIKVVSVLGLGPQTIQRVMAEQRAGKFLGDIFLGGATSGYRVLYKGKALDPIKTALVLPEVVDESKWWGGRHTYIDEKRSYLFAFNQVALPFVAYNSKLVQPGEIRSYWDLLHPRWKGKIVALDPTMGSAVDTALLFLYSAPGLGPEYLRRLLSETDLVASRDSRQIVDWLAAGKFAFCVFTPIGRTRFEDAKSKGLPVDWFGAADLKEGVPLSTGSGNAALLRNAPHPEAARVAINWLLSREGQAAFQNLFHDRDSLRTDVPKDNVVSYARRVEGGVYLETDSPERRDMEPIRRVVQEAWKKRN